MVEGVRDVVIGVLGSVFIVADSGGRDWEDVLIEVAEDGVGRIGDVAVL